MQPHVKTVFGRKTITTTLVPKIAVFRENESPYITISLRPKRMCLAITGRMTSSGVFCVEIRLGCGKFQTPLSPKNVLHYSLPR